MIKVVSLSNIDVLLKNKRPRRLTSLLGLYSGGHCADYIGENCSMPTGTDVAGLDALRIVRTRSECRGTRVCRRDRPVLIYS